MFDHAIIDDNQIRYCVHFLKDYFFKLIALTNTYSFLILLNQSISSMN